MQDLMPIAQLILLVIYIIVAIIINGKLKDQNKSQSELMDKMKQYADLFKVEEFKKYVEMKSENIREELEKKKQKELEEQRSAIEESFKKRVKEGEFRAEREYMDLVKLAFNLVLDSPENKRIDAKLGLMTDSKLKRDLMDVREHVRAEWKAEWTTLTDALKQDPNYSPSMLAAILLRMQPTLATEKDKK